MTPILTRFATAALVALLAYACGGPARAAEPVGTWLTEDGRARVRTEPCAADAARLCGTVVWLQKPLDEDGRPRRDRYNPDPRRQARPVLGHQMLLGLGATAEGRYAGRIYNGDNGKFYDVTVWSETPTALTVKGCMLTVFCGSQTWTRVTEPAPGQLRGATGAPDGPRLDPEWAARPAVGTAPKTPPAGKAAPAQ
ncbi:DUF2147 domain-containing protein [Methylobacterium sp. NEAU 140]|uniref:DUF2147 domain-containing protein n=1 Tax=Methylobacterium sp. NEAU 140 TaxID=3064945 RepID=UPI002732C54C|nr:DUF2147 domain-containing protein [Methylobacterium sp. NEAU 140]MDP4021748.1 DUF2147 domain-containing protein [Methylobacterium sp. NEAU 140]